MMPIFGLEFPLFFPIILIILCFFTLFDVYSKILNFLGFNSFTFSLNFEDDGIEDGRKIVDNGPLFFSIIIFYNYFKYVQIK